MYIVDLAISEPSAKVDAGPALRLIKQPPKRMRPTDYLKLLDGVIRLSTDISLQLHLDTDITVQLSGAFGIHIAMVLPDEVAGLLPAEVGNLEQLEQNVKFDDAEWDLLWLKRRTRLKA